MTVENKQPIKEIQIDPKIKAAIQKVSSTKPGKDFLKWLMYLSGFKASTITVSSDGTVQKDAMIYNEARRGVWIQIRQQIPAAYLSEIEMEIIPNADDSDVE